MERAHCQAMVIGSMEYREADRIVTLFTEEHGVVRALARGARRSTKRFGGALELFARLSVRLVIREGLSTLEDAEIQTIFPSIRQDFARIGFASYACELVGALLPEGMANGRVFRLLETYLRHLDSTAPSSSDRRFFEINLLNILGYRPPVDDCASCGETLGAEGGWWRQGNVDGILCPRCCRGGEPVAGSTLSRLRQSLRTGRFGVVQLGDRELAEAGALLDATIASHLSRPLKTLAFLRLSP